MSAPALPTQEELFQFFTRYSNWNRWGPDDVRGTLNHITNLQILAARDLIQTGKTVSLAWDVAFNTLPRDGNAAVGVPMRHMHASGADNGTGTAPAMGHYVDLKGQKTEERAKAVGSSSGPVATTSTGVRGAGCSESISFTFHGYTTTHLDSLAHMFWDGYTYNGYNAAQTVNLREGAVLLDVVAAARGGGIVGRGILLDAAEFGMGKGGSGKLDSQTGLAERWMEPGEVS
jgi:hypothetical protein